MIDARRPRPHRGPDPDDPDDDQDRPAGPLSGVLRRDNWPLLLFLALSWASTTFGLTRLISAEQGDPSAGEYLIVGAFVFAATASMKLMLDLALVARQIWRRTLALFAYLLLMAFSVFFGFAFYWELLEARAQSFDSARGALASANRELATGRATLQAVSVDIVNLRQLSADAAERERREGYTCEATAGPGDGPRRYFRDQEARRYAADARLLNDRIAEIDDQIEQANARLSELNALAEAGDATELDLIAEFDAINAALIEIETSYNALLESGVLDAVRRDYTEAAQWYADPSHVRRGRDATGLVSAFICYDPALAQQLRRITGSIAGLAPVSFPTVEVLKDARATDEAFDRLATSIVGLFRWSGPSEPTAEDAIAARAELRLAQREAERGDDAAFEAAAARFEAAQAAAAGARGGGGLIDEDYLPLITATIVDVMILIFTLIQGPQMGPRMEAVRAGMTRARMGTLTAADVVRLSRRVSVDDDFQLLEEYRFTYNDRDYIAVPVTLAEDDDDAQDDQNIDTLMRALAAKGLARRAHPMLFKATETVSTKLAQRGSGAAGREAYEIYRLSNSFWSELIDGFFCAADDAERDGRLAAAPAELAIETREAAPAPIREPARRSAERSKEAREAALRRAAETTPKSDGAGDANGEAQAPARRASRSSRWLPAPFRGGDGGAPPDKP